MTPRPLILLAALLGACASDAPEPAAPPPEPPPIQTAAVAPATAEPAPAPAAESTPVAAAASALLPAPLTLAQIQKTFDHHRRFFHRLYAERLRAKPRLAGTVLVSFSVNADGTTQPARVAESNLGDPEFEQAVLRLLAQMNFPPATGPTPVERYPLYFTVPKKK